MKYARIDLVVMMALAGVVAGGFSPHGTWVQPLSNYYVQTTSEIDWKCVKADFYREHGNLYLVKTAYLHDPSTGSNVTTVPALVTFDTANSTMTLSSDVLDIRYASEHIVVVTGRTTPSVYVWTTNLERYLREDEAHILSDLSLWGYTNIDKTPQTSYTTDCDHVVQGPIPHFSNRHLRVAH